MLIELIHALVAGEVAATPPPRPGPGSVIIQRADWAARPTVEDILRVYPAPAKRLGVGGKAVIECRVRLTGAVEQCTVVREEPAGLGFGEAAVRLSAVFKLTPELHDGVPFDGGSIKIPVSFGAMDVYGPPRRLTYPQALDCIGWHSARLLFMPGDAVSTAGLAKSEATARVTGQSGGKSAATVETQIANARFGDLETFARRGAPSVTEGLCAGGF